MAAPLSFLMVKTGGLASPDFSGYAPCFMTHTLANHRGETKRVWLVRTAGTSGVEIQMGGLNLGINGYNRHFNYKIMPLYAARGNQKVSALSS